MFGLKENVLLSMFGGISSSFGSLFGKLSGSFESWLITLILFVIMIAFNTLGMVLFSKSLNLSVSSLEPTLITTASNYVSSALIGIIVFGEGTPPLWWLGTSLILAGMVVIASNKQKTD